MGRVMVTRDYGHRERVQRKYSAVETLKALREMWQQLLQPDDPYLLHLDRRIHKLESQLKVMRP
jgi:hypothetical protein